MDDHTDSLDYLRSRIDDVDRTIIVFLAQRMRISESIGKVKRAHVIDPHDPKRWADVLVSRGKLARELGVSENLIYEIFAVIHRYSLHIQQHQK